jgi:tetratricopeptide (TPR) repeat protein
MAGNPANPVLMIQTMLQQKRFAEAEAAATSLVRQKPGPQTTVIEAQVMAQTRGAEVAVKALQAAALKFPASPEVQNALAQTCMAAKRFDDAAVAYARLIRMRPGDGNLIFAQAMALGQSATPEKALPIYQKLIQARPDMPELHYNHGLVLKATGRLDEAEAAYREAIRLNPGLLPAWGNLANLLIDLGRVSEAFEVFQTRFEKRRARGIAEDDPELSMTSAAKLRHDLEQLRYLDGLGKLDTADKGLIDAYGEVLAQIETSTEDRVPLTRAQLERMDGSYQRILRLEPGEAMAGDVLNPDLDRAAIEAAYHGDGQEIAIVDNVLTPETMERLRTFLNDSSVWHQWRFAKENGYLGARMADGFSCPLIVQISEAFRTAFPSIFKQHTLRMVWAFKHSERIEGVPIHADFAAVNVNLYTTPDEANLDPDTGGLLVWPVKAPLDWEFSQFNSDEGAMERLVAESGAPMVRAAHRQNRIVMFNSDYAHQTDELHFKPGYMNRRINVTMLFGKREDA